MGLYFGSSKRKIISNDLMCRLMLQLQSSSSSEDRTVILEETTFDGFSDEEHGLTFYAEQRDLFSSLTWGEEYVVVWDGVEYVCTAKDSGYGDKILGNLSVDGGEDTGEPFCIVYIPEFIDEICATYVSLNGGTSHTIAIYQKSSNRTVILEEQTIECTDKDGVYGSEQCWCVPIIPDVEYIVAFDGVEYTCTAILGDAFVLLGNNAMVGGEDTGEPFLFGNMGWDNMCMIGTNDTAPATHTIAIYNTSGWTNVFEKQTISGFTYKANDGYYVDIPNEQLFELEAEEIYTIVWDDVVYYLFATTLTLAGRAYGIGLGDSNGGFDNHEICIGYRYAGIEIEGVTTTAMTTFGTSASGESHTVAIYKA